MMRPLNGRPSRRERRRAWKGIPAGRRSTHTMETAYGREQQRRERQAAFSAFCAQRREMAATAAGRRGLAMPIAYEQGAGFQIVPENCEDCGKPRYDTGCDAPGCDGYQCHACGTGCDADDRKGRCATALAAESDEDYEARVNAERAAFGLRPLAGEAAE